MEASAKLFFILPQFKQREAIMSAKKISPLLFIMIMVNILILPQNGSTAVRLGKWYCVRAAYNDTTIENFTASA